MDDITKKSLVQSASIISYPTETSKDKRVEVCKSRYIVTIQGNVHLLPPSAQNVSDKEFIQLLEKIIASSLEDYGKKLSVTSK